MFKDWKSKKDKLARQRRKKDEEFMEWSNQDILRQLKERQRRCVALRHALSKNSIRANMKPVPDPVEFKAEYEKLQCKSPLAVGLGSPVFVAFQKKMEAQRQKKLQTISETPVTPSHAAGGSHGFNDDQSTNHSIFSSGSNSLVPKLSSLDMSSVLKYHGTDHYAIKGKFPNPTATALRQTVLQQHLQDQEEKGKSSSRSRKDSMENLIPWDFSPPGRPAERERQLLPALAPSSPEQPRSPEGFAEGSMAGFCNVQGGGIGIQRQKAQNLDPVLQQLDEARRRAFASIRKADVIEYLHMKRPPSYVSSLTEAICRMFLVEPTEDDYDSGSKEKAWLMAARRHVLRLDCVFIKFQEMMDMDVLLEPEVLRKIEDLLMVEETGHFRTYDQMRHSAVACVDVYFWAVSMLQHMVYQYSEGLDKAIRDKVAKRREEKRLAAVIAAEHRRAVIAAHAGTVKTSKEVRKAYTAEEIEHVIKYIDDVNNSSDGRIEKGELAWAFRRSRRAKAEEKAGKKGKKVILKLEKLMKAHDINWKQWFSYMDGHMSGFSNGLVTLNNLKVGLKKMAKDAKDPELLFKEKEMEAMMAFMDPNGDNALDREEVDDAVRRCHLSKAATAAERNAAEIMERLEKDLAKAKMGIQDLFTLVDQDQSGYISADELREWLNSYDVTTGLWHDWHDNISDANAANDDLEAPMMMTPPVGAPGPIGSMDAARPSTAASTKEALAPEQNDGDDEYGDDFEADNS